MAVATLVSGMAVDGGKGVHPFFQRAHGQSKDNANRLIHDSEDGKYAENANDEQTEDDTAKPKRNRRKPKPEGPQIKGKIQRTLSQIASSQAPAPPQPDNLSIFISEPDYSEEPRKRRRTSDHGSVNIGADNGEQEERRTAIVEEGGKSPQVLIPRLSPLTTTGPPPEKPQGRDETALALNTPPKKLLRLNPNGKFSSPPSKKAKEEPVPDPEQTKIRRGRSRNIAGSSPEQHLIAKLSYGEDETSRAAVGARISRIFSGEENVPIDCREPLATPRKTRSKRQTPKDVTPNKPSTPKVRKPTHPFFGRNKAKEEPPALKHESPRKMTAITPGKIRMQAMSDRQQWDLREREAQPFSSALLKDRLMIKHPGAQEPPFPAREQRHVRCRDEIYSKLVLKDSTLNLAFKRRKRKQAQLHILPKESILMRYAANLAPEGDRTLRLDGFYEPCSSLQRAKRLIIPGQEISRYVSGELSVTIEDCNVDEISLPSSQSSIHPALRRLYHRIPTTLSAFDESRGESITWTQKYAPTICADVLQPDNEISVLKEWLKSLAVQAVGGAAPMTKAAVKQSEKPKKKRKKTSGEMDDFLVDSDEDIHEMSELIASAQTSPDQSRKVQKSFVQVVDDGGKVSNVVLLSGSHGCGKTAAAYAVAKELGFKVFEISSSERRNGKDVLDRIGDMTENHLVKHHGTGPADVSEVEEPTQIDQAFQKDLQSGRQGKMSAFFKSSHKSTVKSKPVSLKSITKEKTLKAVQDALKKPPKDQQQSLILLEEADIIFKDDKDFWGTILKLITTSRRPFIMTCNDEDLMPLQAISLHAILRFNKPPVDLATDYMLLVAAAEGHLLRRGAVTSLYQHHDHDLRGSIMELDYWCQMGVGDPREGLSWIYQRWPPGSDLDAKGRKLRVVSEGTYQGGMGLAPSQTTTVEDAVSWAWTEFDVEPAFALGWSSVGGDSDAGVKPPSDCQKRHRSLARHAHLAEALSAADVFTAIGLPTSAPLDSMQPELPEKALGNYIEGMPLLQTDEITDHLGLSKRLLIETTLAAYTNFGEDRTALQSQQILSRIPASRSKSQASSPMTRHAYSCFDAISSPAEVSLANPGLLQSAFDGPQKTIATDLAPYVRAIVQHDQALEEQREQFNSLTTDGRKVKRARTTRAARSALEGGLRSTTRRERWFTNALDMQAVLATGGKDWPRVVASLPLIEEVRSRDEIEGSVATPGSSADA